MQKKPKTKHFAIILADGDISHWFVIFVGGCTKQVCCLTSGELDFQSGETLFWVNEFTFI